MGKKHEIRLTTYAELRQIAKHFADRKINLMMLIGSPGLGKTQILEESCQRIPYLKVDGKKNPIDLFIDLYHNLDELTVLDDTDGLLDNKDGQVLIRQLTDTKAVRRVSWGTRTSILASQNPPVPNHFDTTSPVCVITNRRRASGMYGAIESRAMVFHFDPPWTEAYEYATTWFKDQEILDFIHSNLGHLRHPDLRLLDQAVKLRNLRLANHDWRTVFSHCLTIDMVEREVRRLTAVKMPNAERARQFVQGGFGDRATFYRRLKEILARKTQPIPPRIIVTPKVAGGSSSLATTTSTKTPATASKKASRKPKKTGRERKPLPR
jgi:hypothetical protein